MQTYFRAINLVLNFYDCHMHDTLSKIPNATGGIFDISLK